MRSDFSLNRYRYTITIQFISVKAKERRYRIAEEVL